MMQLPKSCDMIYATLKVLWHVSLCFTWQRALPLFSLCHGHGWITLELKNTKEDLMKLMMYNNFIRHIYVHYIASMFVTYFEW